MSNNVFKPLGLGLGYTASKKRTLLEGRQYDALFPRPKLTDPRTEPISTLGAVALAKQIVLQTLADSVKVAKLQFVSGDLNKTCNNIWNFFYKHYQYKLDEPGVEQLRRPARAWHDRKEGIDCDCFSISVSSMLTNLGIRHYFRVVKMYGNDYYQHIYVVVPKNSKSDMSQRSDYYVIDPVVDSYDFEPRGVTFKTDIPMMPVQFLNGVDNSNNASTQPFLREFNTLGDGVSGTDNEQLYGEFLGRLKRHLINTRNEIQAHPRKVSKIYRPEAVVAAINGLLGMWDNEAKREAELERLSGIDETLLQPHLQGLGDLLGDDETLFGLINTDHEQMEGLGATKKKAARKSVTGKTTPTKKAGPITSVKNAKKVAKVVTGKVKANKPETKKVQDASKGKAKQVLKKVGRAVVKNNPVTLSMRAGFLAAMKTNFARLASRAYWAYFTQAEAAKYGVSANYYARAKQLQQALEKTFVGKLKGQSSALQKAIVTGLAAKTSKRLAQKGKMNGIDALNGLTGLGIDPATDTVIASSMVVLTPLIVMAAKIFKGNGGGEVTESGTEMSSALLDKDNALTDTLLEVADVATANNRTVQAAKAVRKAYVSQNEAAYTTKVEAAPKVSSQSEIEYDDTIQTQDENGGYDALIEGNTSTTKTAPNEQQAKASDGKTEQQASNSIANDNIKNEPKKEGGSTGMIVTGLTLAGIAAVAITSKSKTKKAEKKAELSGTKNKIKTIKI